MPWVHEGGHSTASTALEVNSGGLTIPAIPAAADFIVAFQLLQDATRTIQLAPATATAYGDPAAVTMRNLNTGDTQHLMSIAPKSFGWDATYSKLFLNSTGPIVHVVYFSGGIQLDSSDATSDFWFYSDSVSANNDIFVLNGYDINAEGLIIGTAERQNFSGSAKGGTVNWLSDGSTVNAGFFETMSDTHGYAAWGRSGSDGNGNGQLFVLWPKQVEEQSILGTLTFNGIVTTILKYLRVFSGTIAFAGQSVLTLLLSRFLSGVASLSGQSIPKAIWKRFYSGILTAQASLTWNITYDVVLSGLLRVRSLFNKSVVMRIIADVLMRIGITGEEVTSQIEMFVTSSDNEFDVEVRR